MQDRCQAIVKATMQTLDLCGERRLDRDRVDRLATLPPGAGGAVAQTRGGLQAIAGLNVSATPFMQ